jgi:hypothetical protein
VVALLPVAGQEAMTATGWALAAFEVAASVRWPGQCGRGQIKR